MPIYKVISYGLGPIGASIARITLERQSQLEIIGAVDIDPSLIGRDLGDVLPTGNKTGIKIQSSAKDLYKYADIVLHATGSFLDVVKSQLLEFCENQIDVVSTNEELSFPWYNHNIIAEELDLSAKNNKCTLLGTGVNPGFVMDYLPIVLSGATSRVDSVHVTRILDATSRRVPFQKKVGIGLTVEEFKKNVSSGKFGHVGLPESIAMVCSALGRHVDSIRQSVSPKVTNAPIQTEHFGTIKEGRVIGLVQNATAFSEGKEVARYHIEMYAGARDAKDEIILHGDHDLKLVIPGGTPGDSATVALVVNSVPRVVESAPGLLTVKDLRPALSILS